MIIYTEFYLYFFLLCLNILFFLKYNSISSYLNLVDVPNKKNLVQKKRGYPIGGLIIYLNIFFIFFTSLIFNQNFFYLSKYELVIFFSVVSMLFLLGILDDLFNIKPIKKLMILSVIFFILLFDEALTIKKLSFVFFEKKLDLMYFSKIITIFFLLAFINAFNMFDGINGQSAIYSVLIYLFLLFYSEGSEFLYIFLIFLVIFFYFNIKKNIFLGNAGSLILPFIFSYFSIKYYNTGIIQYSEQIYIVMCIPGLDMLRLFIERISSQKNPFYKDQNHLHHLIFKKMGLFKTNLIIQSSIIFLIIISFYFLKTAVILSIILYLFIFFIFYKNNNKFS